MAIIQDAQTGITAQVDNENRIRTFSISQSEDKHTNVEGLYNSLFLQVTPAGANDYFWYLQNTSTSDVSITDIRIASTVASQINLHYVSGTPVYITGTETQITNRNLGSSKIPSVITQYDTDITGLVDEGILLFDSLDTANRMYHMKTTSNIIIPQGQAVALRRVAATGDITCLVSITRAES